MNDTPSQPSSEVDTPRAGEHRGSFRFGSRLGAGCLAACAALTLIGCDGGSDAGIGVQTAPPTAQTTTQTTTQTTVVPTSPPSTEGTPASQPDNPQAAIDRAYRQFSTCMRDNGFPDFEDFTSDVFVGATSQEEGAKIFNEEMLRRGVDLADPTTGPAMEACQPYLDEAATAAPEIPGVDEEANQELILAFAKCMRSQGVQDWPDPDFAANPPTGYSIEEVQSFDYQDPAISAAGQYCDPNGEVLALFGR